jgi:hypothetical protein
MFTSNSRRSFNFSRSSRICFLSLEFFCKRSHTGAAEMSLSSTGSMETAGLNVHASISRLIFSCSLSCRSFSTFLCSSYKRYNHHIMRSLSFFTFFFMCMTMIVAKSIVCCYIIQMVPQKYPLAALELSRSLVFEYSV